MSKRPIPKSVLLVSLRFLPHVGYVTIMMVCITPTFSGRSIDPAISERLSAVKICASGGDGALCASSKGIDLYSRVFNAHVHRVCVVAAPTSAPKYAPSNETPSIRALTFASPQEMPGISPACRKGHSGIVPPVNKQQTMNSFLILIFELLGQPGSPLGVAMSP